MTHLLTRQEYIKIFRTTKQNLSNKEKRGTVKTVVATIPTEREMIEVSDEDYERAVKSK